MNTQSTIYVYPGIFRKTATRPFKAVSAVTAILITLQASLLGVLFAPPANAHGGTESQTGMSSLFDFSSQCSPIFGYGVVTGGVGTSGVSDASISLNVPGTPVKSYLVWSGTNTPNEDTITFNGMTVNGQDYRELSTPPAPVAYVADVTALGVVMSGNHTYSIGELNSAVDDGIALVVAYQDTTHVNATAHAFGGADAAYYASAAPLGPDTEVRGWTFVPSTVERTATIAVAVGDSDPTKPNRGDALWAKTGTGALPTNIVNQAGAAVVPNGHNFMDGSAGDSLDVDDPFPVTIPAGATYLALQIESENPSSVDPQLDGESLLWMSATMTLDEDCPSIDLTKTDREDPVGPGDTITYDLDWSVTGNVPVTGLTLTDPVPAETSFVSASNSGQETGGIVTWDLGDQFAGASGMVSLTVLVDDPLDEGIVIDNTATLDSNETNEVTDDEDTTVITDFVLDIQKTDSPDPVNAGSNLTYTIDWSVTGNEIVQDVTVVDTLDTRTTFVSASNSGLYDSTTHTVSWDLGDVNPPLDEGSLTLIVNVNEPIDNGAVLHNSIIINGEEKSATDTEDTTVIADFFLNVDKKDNPDPVNAGSNLTYTIDWSVDGKTIAKDVTLVDTLDENVTWVSGGTYHAKKHMVSWDLGDQDPGASGTKTLVVNVASPMANESVLHNHVELSSGDHVATDDEPTTVLSKSVLSITKVDNVNAPLNPGDEYVYTLTWGVTGNEPVTDVTVTDPLPVEMTFVSASNSGTYTASNRTVTWALGDHVPGDTGSMTLTVTMNDDVDAGDVQNIATITSNETPPVEADEVTPVIIPEVKPVATAPILTIDKNIDVTYANPGDDVRYRITVTNDGDGDAINVILTDALPEHLTFQATGTRDRQWQLGDMAPGAIQTIVYAVDVSGNAVAGDYTNIATVKADNHGAVSDMATLTIRVPEVLGFATTGVGVREIAIFAVGLLMIGTGGVATYRLAQRQRS